MAAELAEVRPQLIPVAVNASRPLSLPHQVRPRLAPRHLIVFYPAHQSPALSQPSVSQPLVSQPAPNHSDSTASSALCSHFLRLVNRPSASHPDSAADMQLFVACPAHAPLSQSRRECPESAANCIILVGYLADPRMVCSRRSQLRSSASLLISS